MSELSQADEYLLDQIRHGAAQGWSELVDRYQGRLLAFARQKVRQAVDAEDLVQDTFISFLKALPNYRRQAGLETFLFTILRHKIIDAFRGRKDNACLLVDVLKGDSGDAQEGSDVQMADSVLTASWYVRRDEQHQQQRELLTAALRELLDGYKESGNFRDLQVVEMIFYCQLRNKDVADVVGLDEKHIALIKHRCLGRIRDRVLRGASGFESDPPDVLLSEIWQSQRLSCLKRSTIGAYLLGTLEPDWRGYIAFHLERLGCQYCLANLKDLQEQTKVETVRAFRDRIMESTIGFLKRS